MYRYSIHLNSYTKYIEVTGETTKFHTSDVCRSLFVNQEKLREIAKERKDREAEMRKRMADIQKKKKEILKEREQKV